MGARLLFLFAGCSGSAEEEFGATSRWGKFPGENRFLETTCSKFRCYVYASICIRTLVRLAQPVAIPILFAEIQIIFANTPFK